MVNRLVPLLLVVGTLVGTLGACGKQIGDSCDTAADCSPNGDRTCDFPPVSPGGYCTILGCDYSTCPEEAACIQFFPGGFTNRTCGSNAEHICTIDGELATPENQAIGKGLPAYDEVCTVAGICVSRSSEIRYCMLTCDSDGDCRDGYECRDLERMRLHGGQPVLAPNVPLDDDAPKFCAAIPTAPS